jgi:hypothetical protein
MIIIPQVELIVYGFLFHGYYLGTEPREDLLGGARLFFIAFYYEMSCANLVGARHTTLFSFHCKLLSSDYV